MPLAEGRAGAGLLLRQNFNDINDNFMIIIIVKNKISERMPLAEGRAGAGLLLPQNNFLDKISKRFRGTRQNFNNTNYNDIML